VQPDLDWTVCPHDHHSIRLDAFNLTASQLVSGLVAKDLLRGDVLKVGQACVAVDHYAM